MGPTLSGNVEHPVNRIATPPQLRDRFEGADSPGRPIAPARMAGMTTPEPPFRLLSRGKVRDLYDLGDGRLAMVASDRISAFDVVLETPIPDKGAILTRLSLWWFDRMGYLAPDHVLSDAPPPGAPADWAGRTMVVRALEMVGVECVARGYLSGSGLRAYRADGAVCGIALPPGLDEGSRLPEPLFTPTTKAPPGEHDEPLTFSEVSTMVGGELAEQLRALTLAVYARGAAIAAERGILLADTKIEIGRDAAGRLVLADELLTPDSSRFWPADGWAPGSPQPSFDKQYVRDWLTDRGVAGQAVQLPAEVVEATRRRYIEAYERLTGSAFDSYLRSS